MKTKVSLTFTAIIALLGLSLGGVQQGVVNASDLHNNVTCGAGLNIDTTDPDCAGTQNKAAADACKAKLPSTATAADINACNDSVSSTHNLNNLIQNIVNVLSTIVGIVAVIMIIIGGFKYITSGGDSNRVGSAKNTIIYAIVGLIIVALAQVIVRFVLAKTT